MHWSKSALLMTAVTLGGSSLLAQAPPPPPPPAVPAAASQVRMTPPARRSPHDVVSAVIGDRRTGARVMVVYGRPYTKDSRTGEVRKIWGGLVPFGKVWRTGANEATLVIAQRPLVFGSVKIPAGVCTIYTLPAEDGSAKLIFNRQFGQWGTVYDETQDLGRVDLKREPLAQPVDQFTIAVENDPAGGGVLRLMWENAQYSAAFTVPE